MLDLLNLPRPPSASPWAYVKVAEGCDRNCGFCAIPSFRGKQRSRSVDDVLSRRTRARLLGRDDSAAAAPRVAELLAEELGWDAAEQAAQVDAYQSISYGKLASDLGQPLMETLRQFAAFDAGASGPFATPLTDAQKTFLTSMLSPLEDAAKGLNAEQATNGIATKAAEDAVDRHGAMQDRLKGLISDITDVDMAEAISKLNNAQVAMQASAQTFSVVQGLSLLNFLDF